MAHCLPQAKDLPTKFWVEAIYYANYLLNLVPTHEFSSMTLFEKWFGKNPSIGHLKKFGCVAWEHISHACKKKMDANSHACIMTGYY